MSHEISKAKLVSLAPLSADNHENSKATMLAALGGLNFAAGDRAVLVTISPDGDDGNLTASVYSAASADDAINAIKAIMGSVMATTGVPDAVIPTLSQMLSGGAEYVTGPTNARNDADVDALLERLAAGEEDGQ